jgi:hypothetical protein
LPNYVCWFTGQLTEIALLFVEGTQSGVRRNDQSIGLQRKLTLVLHRILHCLGEPSMAQDLVVFPFFRLLVDSGGTVLQAVALVTGLDAMAMMGQAVKQCVGHLGAPEHAGPLREAQVGDDDQAGALLEFADQLEEQRTAGVTERQVPEFIEDHQIRVHRAIGGIAGLSSGLFLPRSICAVI